MRIKKISFKKQKGKQSMYIIKILILMKFIQKENNKS